ncbi:23707_t:CDS:2, partial [Cetraspora pellucida]
TSNVSVPTTSNMPVISFTIPNVFIIPSVTHNTPVTSFTDFTNLHMLLQQHYPSVQLFNSLVLNKTNNESHIWDKIVLNIQDSTSSIILKECSKTSFQQKCDSLHQKYHNIKDIIKNTDIQSLIKEQTNTIIETIKEQYLHTCEVQQ